MGSEHTERTMTVDDPLVRSETEPGALCLVVLQGEQIGRRLRPGAAPFVIGRRSGNLVCPDDRALSRRHAELVAEAGRLLVRDLGSTNGTFVNHEPVTGERVLRPGDLVHLGRLVLKVMAENGPEAQAHNSLYRLATTDPLTGAANRNAFDETLRTEVARAARYGGPLSLLLFDIDHFKRVNDTWGHAAGDHVLRGLARLVLARLRSGDLFARYGGEEFALVLLAGHEDAVRYAERMRQQVAAADFRYGDPPVKIDTTVSVGVATFGPAFPTADALIVAADGRLYAAKNAGRDRVCAIDGS